MADQQHPAWTVAGGTALAAMLANKNNDAAFRGKDHLPKLEISDPPLSFDLRVIFRPCLPCNGFLSRCDNVTL